MQYYLLRISRDLCVLYYTILFIDKQRFERKKMLNSHSDELFQNVRAARAYTALGRAELRRDRSLIL